jgi:hypothetical protein
VYILRAPWNNEYLSELEGFPERKHDDQVDASSGAFNYLVEHRGGDYRGQKATAQKNNVPSMGGNGRKSGLPRI